MTDSEGLQPDGPRIPWVRIAAVQLGAGALVSLLSVLFLFEFEAQAVPLGLLAALVVAALGALPPFLGALVAHRVTTGAGRDRRREIVAVAVGAVIGSVLTAIVFTVWVGAGGLGFSAIVAAASAIGFAIWVLFAWRRHGAG